MCDILLPALAGVALLGLLGGAGNNCSPCEPVQAYTQASNQGITIPQLAGQGTNVVYTNQPSYGYAPAPSYGEPAGYGAPAPAYAPGYAASYAAPAEPVAGAYLNPSAGEAGVNVGGVGAGVDFGGPRSY